MKNIHDITVSFSGRNNLEFTLMTIKSFLNIYPELKENIVYFDDESEYICVQKIRELGINVILRSECNFKSRYTDFLEDRINENIKNTLHRVYFMLDKIQRNCKTKYLFISDNDVIYKKRGFLEEYIDNCESGNLMTSVISTMAQSIDEVDKLRDLNLHINNIFLWYYKNFKFNGDKVMTDRVWFYHTFLNMFEIRKMNYEVVTPNDTDHGQFILGNIFDTGVFTINLFNQNNWKAVLLRGANEYCFHLFSMNVASVEGWSGSKFAGRVHEIEMIDKDCENVLDKVGITKDDLINALST